LAQTFSLPLTHVYHSIGQMRLETLQNFKPQDGQFLFFKTRDDWERRIARESSTIISTSPYERDDIVRLFGISADKIEVIPVGVDTAAFQPYHKRVVRKRLGLPPDSPTVLYAGRLEWRKGIGTLVRAMAELVKKWPAINLYIIGGGTTKSSKALDADERERLHGIINEFHLQGHIHFLGARPQSTIPLYYAAADVCAAPSYYEPFGIVPIESMACGTPVVASRTGGMQFTVEDGVTGYLVEPRCPFDLAAKLDMVLEKDKATFAQAARHRVLRHFAWPRIARAAAAHLALLGSGSPAVVPTTARLPKPLLPKTRPTQLQ
jgi:D-inositol-3-phosphate glycosyltransferase